jgi:hypothetical protein
MAADSFLFRKVFPKTDCILMKLLDSLSVFQGIVGIILQEYDITASL